MFLINKSITFILLTKQNAKIIPLIPPDAPFFISCFFSTICASTANNHINQQPLPPLVLYAANHPAHYSICLPPRNSSTHVRPFDCCVDPLVPPHLHEQQFPTHAASPHYCLPPLLPPLPLPLRHRHCYCCPTATNAAAIAC